MFLAGTEDISHTCTQRIVDLIIRTVCTTNPVYLSLDADVIDPGICPGIGARAGQAKK